MRQFRLFRVKREEIKCCIVDNIVAFREWRLDDAESLAQNANNIKIWNNLRDFFPHPYSIEDANRFIDYNLRRKRKTDFAITVNDKAVGAIGFVPQIDVQRHSAEIGYWIGEEYWGRGLISEILTEFVPFIFDTTQTSHLYALPFEYNLASIRALEKSGFRLVGIMEKAAIKNGKHINMHYFEIVKK